jgi:hypothetical protein
MAFIIEAPRRLGSRRRRLLAPEYALGSAAPGIWALAGVDQSAAYRHAYRREKHVSGTRGFWGQRGAAALTARRESCGGRSKACVGRRLRRRRQRPIAAGRGKQRWLWRRRARREHRQGERRASKLLPDACVGQRPSDRVLAATALLLGCRATAAAAVPATARQASGGLETRHGRLQRARAAPGAADRRQHRQQVHLLIERLRRGWGRVG